MYKSTFSKYETSKSKNVASKSDTSKFTSTVNSKDVTSVSRAISVAVFGSFKTTKSIELLSGEEGGISLFHNSDSESHLDQDQDKLNEDIEMET